jgi:hypothetical protein
MEAIRDQTVRSSPTIIGAIAPLLTTMTEGTHSPTRD